MCKLVLLTTFLLALSHEAKQNPSVFPPQQQQACGGQVQICAPLSNLPGQEAYLGGLRGQKGERGTPGKVGPPGDVTVLNVSGLEKDVAILKAQLKSVQDQRSAVCPSITFTFPRKRQVLDYVWYRGYVPSLKAATTCAWINVTDVSHAFTVASYFSSSDNDFVFYSNRRNLFNPHVYGKAYSFAYNWVQNAKVHMCMWFDAESNEIGFSVNGEIIRQTKSYIGSAVRRAGSFILGQEQDAANAGGLDAGQSFTGTIGNFFMWPRVLTASEIRAVARECICPSDFVMAPSMQNVELYGEVSYDVPEECPVV